MEKKRGETAVKSNGVGSALWCRSDEMGIHLQTKKKLFYSFKVTFRYYLSRVSTMRKMFGENIAFKQNGRWNEYLTDKYKEAE